MFFFFRLKTAVGRFLSDQQQTSWEKELAAWTKKRSCAYGAVDWRRWRSDCPHAHNSSHTRDVVLIPGWRKDQSKEKKNIESAAAFDKEEEGAAVKSH